MSAPRLTHPNAPGGAPAAGPAPRAEAQGAPEVKGGKPIRLPPRGQRMPRIEALGRRWTPHEDLYHQVLNRSWSQLFLLIVAAFFAANAFFALFYWAAPGSVSNARPGSFEDAFFFSVQTMATIGYGGMAPATRYAHVVVTVEALAGVLSIALITGITFSKFARPTARVLFSDKVVLSSRDGVPYLMFRMANWRHNQVVEAQLTVMLLVTERTREGEMLRRQIDLPLVRDRTPLFALSWTAMHLVDEKSPFHGPDALARLRAADAEIFLAFTGLDEVMGQIQARRGYRLDDIVPNARFADVLTILPDGTRRMDYRRFHDVVPLAPAEPAS